MPRPIRNIDIYLPLDYNDGRTVEEAKFVALQVQLLRRFGGVTSNQRQFPLQGLWQNSNRVFDDRIVVVSSMDFGGTSQFETYRFLERLKTKLKRQFDQLEILIAVQEMLAI